MLGVRYEPVKVTMEKGPNSLNCLVVIGRMGGSLVWSQGSHPRGLMSGPRGMGRV